MVELKCKRCGGLITPKTNKIGICSSCNSEIVFEEEFEDDDLLATEEYRRANCRKLIKSVSAYGARRDDESLPKEYSSVFNVKKYNNIKFEIDLIDPFSYSGDIESGFVVYDEDGDIIFEDCDDLYAQAGFDTFTVGMYLEYESGGTVDPGDYMAICWVSDSQTMRFNFTIVDEDIAPVNDSTPVIESPKSSTEPKKKGFFGKLFG